MDAMEAPTSAVEKIPAEIWLEIFERVPRSSDLHSVSLACRKFQQLTTRALHRDLVWIDAKHVVQNLDVWRENDGMEALVRSLILGAGTTRSTIQSSRGLAAHYGTMHDPEGMNTTLALHTAMWARIDSFINVSSLALTNMYVHDHHFTLIHALPQLRSLRLEGCVFHGNAARTFNHSTLPITELTLLNVRRGKGADPPDMVHMHQPHNLHQFNNQMNHLNHMNPLNWIAVGAIPVLPPDPLALVLALATAQQLKKLTVDSSADVFRCVFGAAEAQHRGWAIPTTLEELHVVRKRTCVGADSKPAHHVTHGDNQFPDTHLYHFCVEAANLRIISTPIFAPTSVNIAPEALPLTLDRFSGPIETAQLMAAVRDLKALGMLKCGVAAREGITALTNVARVRPGLKMLMMECKGWDGEIVSAVAGNFKHLRRLKIVYDGIGPNDVGFTFILTLVRFLRWLTVYAR